MNCNKPLIEIDGKFLEILVNIIRDQNIQLLKEIAENEGLDAQEVMEMVPLKFALKSALMSFVAKDE